MKIIGVGTDIVNIKRIEKIIKNDEKLFLKKVFTSKEIKIINQFKLNKASKIAMRFAAKEALSKALGTGIGKNLSFLDFEVLNQESGKPYFLTILNKLKKMKFYLSITDDYPWAVAFVIASK